MVEVVQAGAPLLEKIVDFVVDPIKRQFTYMCCFNSNITELETQLKDLETTRQGVRMGADENLRKVRVIGPNVEAWLTSANEVTTEVEGIIQDKDKVKEGCLNGWCPNLKLRYSLSRKAVKKTKVVVDLQAKGVQYTQSSYSPPPACLEPITNRDFRGFESRRLIMEEIIKALKHDEINLIGVCGMGGVGKTTLVKEVAKIAKEDNHFHEVAMVVVSQKPNLTDVQACIAEMLGMKNLHDMKSPEARADLLRKRLLQNNKKVLVILDDIWAEFDLEDMGIPLEGADKNLKVLYTSRNGNLWRDPRTLQTKKDITLEILSKDEAWQLFREKAGDSVDTPDLEPIAKQIVDECGRLPLALVLIGSALSKKSDKNAIKEIWEDMLGRLAMNPLVDEHLHSRLKPSYEFLEDEEAKRLFLLCCLFKEDEDIRLEDLVRYGFGLSLFDGINEMRKARNRVFALVDDLKSRYLLLDSKNKEECVKVHDVVRDMGISIASKSKLALVIHGEVSEWPKKDTYEHYTSISLISWKITELPKGLTCPNLEFLLLDCLKLKELPCQFFEGMEKLKVLVLKNFRGTLALPSSLRNLCTLSLSYFEGELGNVFEFGGLFSLKTLSFCNSWRLEELPEEIGKLVDLRLLDLTGNGRLKRIPPNVISRLVNLEELYVEFKDWEGEGKEEEGRNANLRELEFLSNLNTLEIVIRSDVLIPEVPIFSKLKIYKVIIVQDDYKPMDDDIRDWELEGERRNLFRKCERVFRVKSWIPIPSNRGGIDSLLRSSDCLVLEGKGCNDLVKALLPWDGVDGLQQLKLLTIRRCDTPECLANTMNPVHLPIAQAPAIFPILKVLDLLVLMNLREICGSTVPAGSFGELTSIRVHNCGRLRNLFQLPIVGCLRQLKCLIISSCGMMEEVFWKDQQEDVHAATNRIEFPKLEVLKLVKLPSLVGFCRGIDQIDFPQLKELYLEDIPQVNLLFHNNGNLSSNSKRNDNFGFLSLFPEKVSLPNLEALDIHNCNSLRYVFAPTMTKSIPELRKLEISSCEMLSKIVAEENGLGERSVDEVEFPQLESLQLLYLPNLVSFFPIVNTTTLKKSTDHLHNPMQPQPFFNEKVAILCLEDVVRDLWLWGSELPTSSFSNLKNVKVAGCLRLRNFPITSTQGLQEVAQLLYTDIGKGLLALESNGTMTLWKWRASQRNPSGMATTSVLPQQWQPAGALAMTNNVIGVNLEEAVPCMALSKNESYIISACGGKVSLFNRLTFQVMTTFMPPPPTSTFLAFYPQDNNIIAIGMEDSTIRIYNVRVDELKSELKGHKKRITGLAFSTKLNKLVSSGADAQLCIWSTDTWEKLKSVPIQLPAGTACNGDTRVLFHSDQIRLLVSHETQLAIYDASEMDCIRQWVPQDVLPAPISFAAYSCDSQLVYTSFCDGNIGVFDADSLTLTHRIAPSAYSPTLSSGSHAVYPLVVATHPQKPNQFAIGLTNGSVIIMEPQESEGKWGLSSNTSNHAFDQNQRKEEEELDEDKDDQEEKRKKKEKGKAPQSG